MYVCVCNAVTEDDVRDCVASGACTTKEVKAACGWKPGCGSCTRKLCSTIVEARLSAAAGLQGTALDCETPCVEMPAALDEAPRVEMPAA
jgi:bacterioferritin-associated ferredoxin